MAGTNEDEFAELCSQAFVQRRLAALTAALSPEAGAILLPSAQRAVDALRDMQDGFFLRLLLGADAIDVPGRPPLDPDRAVATYIKVLRDTTHGHGARKPKQVELTNTLLAHHDGVIPHDLGLLGYLHLLDLLAHPGDLAQHLYGGGKI
jgi:hypothetical protein